jgi:cathepsin A (carboxypeptidase C)
MKLLASAALVGAATAAVTNQQYVLGGGNPLQVPIAAAKEKVESWVAPLANLAESMKKMPAEAKALWDEMTLMFPEQMSQASFFSSPKPSTRRKDSEWDYVVKGADVQAVWVENAKGEKEREIDGKLESYNLRAKKVDPAALGVDTVKQYSGYLDDEENDKHLFYCK